MRRGRWPRGTAYDRYALEAFRVDSVDYLLAPVAASELARALAKRARLAGTADHRDVSALLERMRALLAEPAPGDLLRLAVRTGDRVDLVEVSDVTYFHAKDKLTMAVTRERAHAIDLSIAELERRLPPRHWVRIHRATLVRVAAIKGLRTWFGSRLLVQLEDGTWLEVARDRASGVRDKLGV